MKLISPLGARRRIVILPSSVYLAASLVTAVFALSATVVVRGQPEIHQAMDNRLDREGMIKRSLEFPSTGNIGGYPELLTVKTSGLLTEAQHMLNRVKNVRERRWVERFVHRLRLLSAVLKRSVSVTVSKIHVTGTIKENTKPAGAILEVDNISLPSSSSPLNETTVPESTPKKREFQKTSKYPVTIPELNGVLPVPGEQQVVTKPALALPSKGKKSEIECEDDELVRELEELPKIAASEHLRQSKTEPRLESKEVDKKPPEEFSSSAPPKRFVKSVNSFVETEKVKSRIKEHLAEEVAALHRLGETNENIMHALHYDDPSLKDMTNPNLMFKAQPKVDRGSSKVDARSFSPTEGKETEGVKDLIADESIISTSASHNPYNDTNIWKPAVALGPTTHVLGQSFTNNTLPVMPINLPKMNRNVLSRPIQKGLLKYPSHQSSLPSQQNAIRDTIQRLQRQHQNFLLKHHFLEMPQVYPNMKHNMFVPGYMRQAHFFPPNNKDTGNHPFQDNHENKYIHTPYPYFQNFDHKNLTLQGMKSPFPNPAIGTNFSDDMKRQLRDGKVILMSDNVIRSNFEPELEKEKMKVHIVPTQVKILVEKENSGSGSNETSAHD